MNLNGVEYYYIRNAQGDITGLFDKKGDQVVAYTYDTWGKLISTTGALASTVGVKNPYLYRGYRYDTETGLYYLQSRYYNADWGRFINADGNLGTPGELLSHNLFAYCGNNPINRADQDGESFGALLAGLGAILAIPAEIATAITVAAIVLTAVVIYAIVDIAVKEYRNHHVSYVDSSAPAVNKTKPTSSGKSKNKLKPDTNAEEPHSTFKRNPDTGKITNYETWKPNPRNPKGFDSEKRYDGTGRPHKNPFTGEELMPHVHDKTVPGDVRQPIPWEVPK